MNPWDLCPPLSDKINKKPDVSTDSKTRFHLMASVLTAVQRSDFWSCQKLPWVALKHDSIQKILPGIKIGLPLSKDYITRGNICMFHLFSHWFKSTEFKGLSDNLLTRNKGPVFFLFLPPCSSPKPDEWYNPYGWLYSWDINLICYYYADP